MKKSLGILLFLCSFFYSYPQDVNEVINGLKSELKTNPGDKRTAIIYSDLAWYYSNVSIDSALSYGAKAIRDSKKLGDSILLAQVYSDIGAVYFRKGDFQSSKKNYLQAYAVRKAQNDAKGIAKINNNLASVYMNLQQYEPAMKSFLNALEYFESMGDELNVNVTKSNIGLLQIQLNNYPKAIKYLKEAIRYNEKNNLHDRLCESYLNLGKAYVQLKDTVNATRCLNKSLENCKLTGNKKAISIVYQSLGLRQKKTEVSKKLYEASKKYSDGFNSDLDKANLQLSVARTHIALKEFKQARVLLLKIKKVFEDKKSNEDLLFAYKLLVPVYAHLNQPDSVVFYNEKYTSLSQELIKLSVLKQTSDLEARYQTEKKEKLLLQAKADVEKKSTLFYSALILALFITIIALLIYRQQKLKNMQQEQEFDLKTAISMIETQNRLQEQRLTISRDLHDNIGAQLTFIISSVDNIKHGFDIQNIKLNDKLNYISNFTKSTIVELRDTIWAMNNNEIHFEDLRARILNFMEKARCAKENIDFNFVIEEGLDQERLSSVVGMNIYRTIQEAVNNAIKYSDASEIRIEVGNQEHQITIEVSDNGIGFDFETTEIGNGLHNMKKRIEDIKGIFSVSSETGKGTSIHILIEKPLLNK